MNTGRLWSVTLTAALVLSLPVAFAQNHRLQCKAGYEERWN